MKSEDFVILGRKYRSLSALRARRDAGTAAQPAARSELRELAAEFPGCLRELDTLGATELIRRAEACEAAAGGTRPEAEPEPWMAWIAGYHALMRAALLIRAGQADHAATEAEAAELAGADSAFPAAVLSPPEGRISVVVLQTLATKFGVPATEIAAALFPVRRPSPYRL